jgi:hypothetical protein
MKILLVTVREDIKALLEAGLSDTSPDIIQYWHPIKAMDNLDELVPQAVVFSGLDFPRHWKPFIVYYRSCFPDAAADFFLLTPSVFDIEERKKADFLGATCLAETDLQSLQDLLRSRLPNPAARPSSDCAAYVPLPGERVEVLFTSPTTLGLVFGRVNRLWQHGFSFNPIDPEKAGSLGVGTQIGKASFSLNGRISNVSIEVVESSRTGISCLFMDAPAGLTESIAGLIA